MIRLAALSILVLAGLVPLAADQQGVFRGTVQTVPVYVTVTDKSGRLATDLSRDDFQLKDNGRAQVLTQFDSSPQPIKLIVLLDVSTSMLRNLPLMQAACNELFSRLRPDDRAKVGTFGREIIISPSFTNDLAALRAALPTTIADDAPTPLWKAVMTAMAAFEGAEGRRVVLVLSDSKDAGPLKFGEKFLTVLEVIDRAQQEDVMVYGVGLQSRGRVGPQSLQDMAADLVDPLPRHAGGRDWRRVPGDQAARRSERRLRPRRRRAAPAVPAGLHAGGERRQAAQDRSEGEGRRPQGSRT